MKAGNAMLSKNQIKIIRLLQTKKHRQKYQKFTVEGEKIVREALMECPERLEGIIVNPAIYRREDFSISDRIAWWETDETIMKELSTLQTPPGIIGLVSWPAEERMPSEASWLLYVDGLRDPGNLGTILRTADWFGFRDVLLGPGTVDWSNPKVLQASMGSIFRVRCHAVQPDELSRIWPDHQRFAADMEGMDCRGVRWPEKGILMMGSESHGIHALSSREQVTHVAIKRNPGSRAESLNVATAAGILMSQIAYRLVNS
ncbi:MAG: RNA methyltransferase [Saprospiraceae bacterium]|nr:RNA methyltransferase [Saprospiraceae bacterium]